MCEMRAVSDTGVTEVKVVAVSVAFLYRIT